MINYKAVENVTLFATRLIFELFGDHLYFCDVRKIKKMYEKIYFISHLSVTSVSIWYT